MKSTRYLRILFTILILTSSLSAVCGADGPAYHFMLDTESSSYRFGFSKEPMTEMNSIPAPLKGDYVITQQTSYNANGEPEYYGTAVMYVYWRFVSSKPVKLHILPRMFKDADTGEDSISWHLKATDFWGDSNTKIEADFKDDGFNINPAGNDSNKPIHTNEGSTICWGCLEFECTTDTFDTAGSYYANIYLELEAK